MNYKTNRIPRKFKTITGTFLSGNVEGKRMVITKDELGYHGRDEEGNMWSVFVWTLRVPEAFQIENIEV